MKHLGSMRTAACAALLFAALTPRAAQADAWDKRTVVTFSDAVQVPGATLPAGKYVFKLVESSAIRYVVQISNERENHVFATVIAIPNYRLKTPEKTIINFYEAPAGQPEPIKAWFYPGDNFGRQFVYKNSEALLIAKTSRETVPTEETSQETSVATTAQPAPADQPVIQEAEKTAVAEPEPTQVVAEPVPVVPEPVIPAPEPAATTTDATVTQDTDTAGSPSMPATGSDLPLTGLIAVLSIASALGVRAARRDN